MRRAKLALGYEVYFSDDLVDGTIVVSMNVIQDDGQRAMLKDHRFGPWADWSEVADWIWLALRDDLPVTVV